MRKYIAILLLLFNLLISSFSSVNTLLASIAYESKQAILAWNCQQCRFPVENVQVFGSLGLQGFAGWTGFGNNIFIVFRGTSNPIEFFTDLDSTMIPYPCDGCFVHKGFYQAWLILKNDAIRILQQLKALYRGSNINVIGHSLGGAISELAILDIGEIFGYSGLISQTYGQPRVGNIDFANYKDITKKLKHNCNRFVHYADIVPHLPPLDLGYIHAGQQDWYDEQMKTFKVCHGDKDGKCSNSLSSYTFDDHPVDKYQI